MDMLDLYWLMLGYFAGLQGYIGLTLGYIGLYWGKALSP